MKSVRTNGIIAATIFASVMMSVNTQVEAHGGNDGSKGLDRLATESALIVRGKVARIRYRNSEPTAAEPNGVPHTFVTYRVHEVVKGSMASSTLTLRFIGGADGRGGVYMETETPVFATGQNDILFVADDQSSGCPLVDCVGGRFRVANNRIYDAWGFPVVQARSKLVVGDVSNVDLLTMELPRPRFEQLIKRPEIKKLLRGKYASLTRQQLKRSYLRQAPEAMFVNYAVLTGRPDLHSRSASASKQKVNPVDSGSFLDVVRHAVDESPAVSRRIRSVASSDRFQAKPLQPLTVKADNSVRSTTRLERRELNSLKEGAEGKAR